ncbi:MAG: Tad domain-containing protein [Xanthomonadaceae bacterium]|nr:Tad domain-containing protein [Xanthomonadaceae bacterium]
MSRKKTQKPKGQVMILVAMLATTFIFFFKFVVDTGILVVAKINLQNAADLAAYSGAASQARLLNQIGFLNYDMRRAYKKFLFQYYVIGTYSYDSFPKTSGTSKARVYSPTVNPTPNQKVPVVCIDYQNMTQSPPTNYCNRLAVIAQPRATGLPMSSAIGGIYNSFVNTLNTARGKNGCTMFGGDNMATLIPWLFNADPTGRSYTQAINDVISSGQNNQAIQQQKKTLEAMQGLSGGMGLLPRLLINKMRIETLAEYINANPERVDFSDMSTLQSATDPAKHERTIEAFYSAYHSLGQFLFDSSSITLKELPPSGSIGNQYVKIETLIHNFTTWFLNAEINGTNGCDFEPTAIDLMNVPIGVYKDPSVLTYYAVRLEAKAKLLYWPNKNFEVKAYAVASPFGGYIGPNQQQFDLKSKIQSGIACPSTTDYTIKSYSYTGGSPLTCPPTGTDMFQATPNLQLKGSSDSLGFDDEKLQFLLASQITTLQGGTPVLDPIKLNKAFEYVMLPNPSELNMYLIPNDAGDAESASATQTHTHENGGDPFNHYFHSPKYIHHFWAPIIPPSNASKIDDAVNEMLNKLNNTGTSSPMNPIVKARVDAMKKITKESIEFYLKDVLYNNGTDSQNGEFDESLFIAGIPDYLSAVRNPPAGQGIDNQFHATKPEELRRSWVTTKDEKIEKAGRVGYSVKFIRLKSVIGKGAPINPDERNTTMSNRLIIDSEMQSDGSYKELDH